MSEEYKIFCPGCDKYTSVSKNFYNKYKNTTQFTSDIKCQYCDGLVYYKHQKNTADDSINPDHYKIGGIETIDYLKAKLNDDQFEGYLVGNILKYVSRYKHKNGIEDIKKARWYLNKLIDTMGEDSE